MKFDYCIGNPPYQEPTEGTRDKPVYNNFMNAAYSISDKVELITPGRFLFDAGATPKEWNRKMLNDEHFKVLEYEADATKCFPSIDFKGGVAITYRDATTSFGAIETFFVQPELNDILNTLKRTSYTSFSQIMFGQGSYRFTDKIHEDYPQIKYKENERGENIGKLSKGHDYDIATSALEKLAGIVLFEKIPNDNFEYIAIIGRKNNQRAEMYIRRDYLEEHPNLYSYKVLLPKANGTGAYGETLAQPIVAPPKSGHTQTFLSIGCFNTENEAKNVVKYIKTKFCRALLSIMKVTQDNPPEKWKYVPLQVFNSYSDIDWSKSITDIDMQLYEKYGFSQEEIDFIETNVKEME